MTAKRPKRQSSGRSPIQPPRSVKAGEPPSQPAEPPRVRRRRKTARSAVRKDTTVFQAAEGPRTLWGRTKPKVKKG